MHFLSLVSLFPVLFQVVFAVDVVFYSNTLTCGGDDYFYCPDVPVDVCCYPAPQGYGFAVGFNNLAGGFAAQPYSGVCATALDKVFGPGTQCAQSGGEWKADGGNWFSTSPIKAKRGDAVDKSANCTSVAPDAFTYKSSGAKRTIKVESGQADRVVALFKAKDFDSLAKFPDHENAKF